jgi:hypothetical protein
MNPRVLWVTAIVVVLNSAAPATADTIYATYQTLSSTGGIARFDADTLEFQGNFATPGIPTDVAYGRGSVYDLEDRTIFRRNPITGTEEGHSASEFDSFAFFDGNIYGATHFPVGNVTAVDYQLLDGLTLGLFSGEIAFNFAANEYVLGVSSNTIYG